MREILHSTRNVSIIEYDPTVPCLIDTVTEYLYLEEFRAHMNKGLELLIEKQKIHREIAWLANTNSQWLFEDWIGRVADAGIRHIASVFPDDEIVRLSNNFYDSDTVTILENGLVLKNFNNQESACEWLRQSMNKD